MKKTGATTGVDAGTAQKKRRANGEAAQNWVRMELQRRGFKMVEPVYTPWRVIRRGRDIVGAYPLEKVSGDFIAITEAGRKVLVEVKSRDEGNLAYSDFEPHQVQALDDNDRFKGLSFVVWVRRAEMKFLAWPIPGFRPGVGLRWVEDKK